MLSVTMLTCQSFIFRRDLNDIYVTKLSTKNKKPEQKLLNSLYWKTLLTERVFSKIQFRILNNLGTIDNEAISGIFCINKIGLFVAEQKSFWKLRLNGRKKTEKHKIPKINRRSNGSRHGAELLCCHQKASCTRINPFK